MKCKGFSVKTGSLWLKGKIRSARKKIHGPKLLAQGLSSGRIEPSIREQRGGAGDLLTMGFGPVR